MENKSRAWTKWVFWFSLAVAVVAVYKVLDNFGYIASAIKNFINIISPFLVGILIAYILYVPCRNIESALKKSKKIKFIKKRARGLSIATTYIIVLILFIILINFILPPVIQSIVDLVNNFGHYYGRAVETINALPEDSVFKSDIAKQLIEKIQTVDLQQIVNTKALTGYVQSIISMLGGVFDIFVSIIVSIYILSGRRAIITFFKKLLGAMLQEKAYENINKYFNRTNEIFFKFLASQILDAVVVGILTSIAMSILNVKYAVLLGFMIGLFNIIPYFGAIIAVILAGIITFFTGGISQAIWMIVVVTILQQIDANIINPRIVGNSLKINPLLVIIAVTIGGAYFGILGMFLAVPVMAVLKLILDDFIELKAIKPEQKDKS